MLLSDFLSSLTLVSGVEDMCFQDICSFTALELRGGGVMLEDPPIPGLRVISGEKFLGHVGLASGEGVESWEESAEKEPDSRFVIKRQIRN